MFLSKILMHLCSIIHEIAEKNVFMDDWKKFNETSLLEKEFFYSYLREISKYLS